ncbi:MAG: phosphatidylglycerol lysyltransferase domain-containing protein [Oscillospiraceae bacterium]
MLEFKDIELSDKEWINEALKKSDYMSCDHSFANYMIWKTMFKIKVCNVDGFFVAMVEDNGVKTFLCPAGEGDICKVLQKLIDYAKEANIPFLMSGIEPQARLLLENKFADIIEFIDDRKNYDYVYLTHTLITLKGKKLHAKRNFINRFKESNWSFEPITSKNKQECYLMSVKWCQQTNCNKSVSAKKECNVTKRALELFEELGFDGGLLRVDGDIVAFSIGEPLNSQTYVVHIEKAFSEVVGAYPTINQEFLNHFASKYKYVNREEDLGFEGLRKAKLSYLPEILLPKFGAKLKNE